VRPVAEFAYVRLADRLRLRAPEHWVGRHAPINSTGAKILPDRAAAAGRGARQAAGRERRGFKRRMPVSLGETGI